MLQNQVHLPFSFVLTRSCNQVFKYARKKSILFRKPQTVTLILQVLTESNEQKRLNRRVRSSLHVLWPWTSRAECLRDRTSVSIGWERSTLQPSSPAQPWVDVNLPLQPRQPRSQHNKMDIIAPSRGDEHRHGGRRSSTSEWSRSDGDNEDAGWF